MTSVVAELPPRALMRIARRRDVQAVEPWADQRPLSLTAPTQAVGAPAWWTAGHTGGTGAADPNPATLAIVGDPVYSAHPALSGIEFERPPGMQMIDPVGGLHGTAVASMAVSSGATGCALCQPSDSAEQGVAPGVSHVLDTFGAENELAWAAGEPWTYWNALDDREEIAAGAAHPAQVLSYSRGNPENADDGGDQQGWDAYVDEFGMTAAIAAGNSGPAPGSINEPADAYNVIGVGAFAGGANATDRSGDNVFSWSSEGPTLGGRKKPDLVAVGNADLADSEFQTDGTLWHYMTGTSFAAPQVAGAATLLAGSGLLDPKSVKSLLINSALPGRAAPDQAMGTQTAWQPDWAWGELDLNEALAERSNVVTATVPANGTRFYRSTPEAAGDRATLVWDRRVTTCFSPGCTAARDTSWNVFTLCHLALSQIDAATGDLEAQSATPADNVQQVRSAAPGPVVYAVSAGQVDGLAGEPFALTAKNPLTPLVSPQPTASLSLAAGAPVLPGKPVEVTATVSNPSPDLTAESATATLTVPDGVAIVGGPATAPLGTLATHGSAGDTATATWTVEGTADGIHQLVATAAATRYGASFSTSAVAALAVDATPPEVTIAYPPKSTTDPSLALAWGATDAWSAVAGFDVEVSVDGAPFAPWLAATTATHATYQATAGHSYRFRVRAYDTLGNTSDFVASTPIPVLAPQPPPPAATTPPRRSPRLALTRVRRAHDALTLTGSLDHSAAAALRLRWLAHGRHGAAVTRPRGGRFSLRIALPRRATTVVVTIRYPGDAAHLPQTLSYRARLSPR